MLTKPSDKQAFESKASNYYQTNKKMGGNFEQNQRESNHSPVSQTSSNEETSSDSTSQQVIFDSFVKKWGEMPGRLRNISNPDSVGVKKSRDSLVEKYYFG